MKTLALEFSSSERSVAICVDGVTRSSATENEPRTTRAFALIEQVLADAGLERGEIECLAVGLGPGSYHGIRAAIAIAQGWQLANDVKLTGISSVECLAAEAQARGLSGEINLVLDAQRNEFYFARCEISESRINWLIPLKLVSLETAQAYSRAGGIVIGPEVQQGFAEGKIIFPTAAMLGKLAAARADFVPGEKLEPIYLRETNFVKAPPPRTL